MEVKPWIRVGPEVQIYSSMHLSAIVSHSNVTLQKQLQTSDKRKGYAAVFTSLKFRDLGGVCVTNQLTKQPDSQPTNKPTNQPANQLINQPTKQ